MRVRSVVGALSRCLHAPYFTSKQHVTQSSEFVSRRFVTMEDQTDSRAETKFVGTLDRYKGVTVKSDKEPCGSESLPEQLARSLADWRREGVRTVWFLVTHADSEWVPVLVSQGFTFHHANTERLALMLWLGRN